MSFNENAARIPNEINEETSDEFHEGIILAWLTARGPPDQTHSHKEQNEISAGD